MKYAPATDRKGQALHPGDHVRVKAYPRGSLEGVIAVSGRGLQVMPDGNTLPTLHVIVGGNQAYSLPSPKGVLKIIPKSR